MSFKPEIKLVEVGPRDGLQNEKQVLPTSVKLELIQRLVHAGFRHIEATSFVSPKWVPQMADHAEILRSLSTSGEISYAVLTPNMKGFESALECGVSEVSVFAAASEAFSQRNINCSIAESLARFEPIMEAATRAGVRVRGYVSCVAGCPYEGVIEPESVAVVAESLYRMGCYEISLGDTIGIGTPDKIIRMLDAVVCRVPVKVLAGHYHDTHGHALSNILASYQSGMRIFDSSVSGLGGCPYAAGASGNVATEDVVQMFHDMDVVTGIDLEALIACSVWISKLLQRVPGSKAAREVA